MLFVIKFFPEIIIKSKPVRKQMSRRLQDNLITTLRPIDPKARVTMEWDKLTVELKDHSREAEEEALAVLQNTSGISLILEVAEYEFSSLDDVCEKTLDAYRDRLVNKRFVVRCKRVGRHEYTSHQVEQYVGGFLLQHSASAGVDLHHPEITVFIEIRDNTLHVVKNRIEGLGGFPLGEVEPVLSLISGGFDSPVASYLMMKRGAPTHFCFFNLGGREHELGVKEVAYFLWQKFGAGRRIKFISVPFEPVVAEILEKVDNSQMGVILKRMMLRVAERLAAQMDIKALVTGEAIAQVSSQTLTNLSVIDSVTNTLVLRPLIASDKEEIIRTARKIGTFEFAEHMPEYCGVISVKPTTKARIEKILAEEAYFNMALLDEVLARAQFINIDEMALQSYMPVDVEEMEIPLPDSVIIDVRSNEEQERRPLILAGQKIEHIPFYKLHTAFAELAKEKRYLLYCEKGVMSRLHAVHLVEEGYNVAVYRPLRHKGSG
jgi:tRNA uracil 4-sulfurtransferase